MRSPVLSWLLRLWTAHRARLAGLFAGVLVPLLVFGALADEVWEREGFAFDEPILRAAHALATPARDAAMVAVSKLGYAWGVVPMAVLLPLALLARRRGRAALYAATVLGGTSLLNLGAKALFGRPRPALWPSVAPEPTFSFPSGHAMGSMALAVVLVTLAGPTRWRALVAGASGAFVVLVGVSRVYLGVHYPSDILAGWMASLAWGVGVGAVLRRDRARAAEPPPAAGGTSD